MNYELAKKLKDAGFPHNWCSEDDCSCLTNGKESECFPTLSELIEACGTEFSELKLIIGYALDDTEWWACSRNKFNKEGKNIRGAGGMIGKTPEEAMARLWLKLNNK